MRFEIMLKMQNNNRYDIKIIIIIICILLKIHTQEEETIYSTES